MFLSLMDPGSFPKPRSASKSCMILLVFVTHGLTRKQFKPTQAKLAIKQLPWYMKNILVISEDFSTVKVYSKLSKKRQILENESHILGKFYSIHGLLFKTSEYINFVLLIG